MMLYFSILTPIPPQPISGAKLRRLLTEVAEEALNPNHVLAAFGFEK